MDRRQFLVTGAAAGVAGALPLAAEALPAIGGRAFGSYWRVVAAPGAPVARIVQTVEKIVAEVDAGMSPWRADSNLSALNAARADSDWQPLTPDLALVLGAALRVAERTSGTFDPTVGGIVGRYGFGPIHAPRVGSVADLSLNGLRLRRSKPGMTLDLCGIAKGWALDRIATALRAAGIGDALVELGGEVATLGRHPDGRPWRVAIDRPDGQAMALTLDGRAVASSGDRPQGYDVAGHGYGHIIDPKRGAPATGDLAQITVLAGTAMEADALATALFAMGTEGAGAMAETLGLDAVLLVRDGGGLRALTTGRAGGLLL